MKFRRYLYVFTVSLFCVGACWAQQALPAPKMVVIRAGRLLDVKTGKTLTNQIILIQGDKIASVGSGTQVPDGAQVVDLSNATVLPGLIDAHTHITMTTNFGYSRLGISVPREALNGARNARVTLDAGFTTIRNVGASGFTDVALRDAINAGDVPGPRMLVSGPALSITGGHCDNNLLPFESHVQSAGVGDGVEAVQHKTREIIKYGADLIKICAPGGVLSHGDNPQASQYTLDEMKAIVTDAHRLGRKVAAHAHGAQGILWATQAGVDSIEHGSYMNDEDIAAMKAHGTYFVPTAYLVDWMQQSGKLPAIYEQKMKDVSAVEKQNAIKAIKAGVKVALGTDAAVYPHGLNAHEVDVYVNQFGMSPLQGIQTGTINAADL